MPRTGSRPVNPEFASYAGRVMVDSFRGSMRIRKWPEKRGVSKSALVREMNEWFAAVNQLIKFAPAEQHIAAIVATKGKGVYPRDLLMHTISEGIMDITELDGTFVQHRRPRVDGVAFQGARLQRINPYTVVTGDWRTVTWEDPIMDTAAMWDVSDPTVLTIPLGVTVCEFFFGAHSSQFPNTLTRMAVRRVGGNFFGNQDSRSQAGQVSSLTTGPLPVVAGERYSCQQWNDATMAFLVGTRTYFSAQILGTT